MVQMGDYAGGLNLHTQLVSGPDFSQISSFMPGLKVLLQSALQLGVYLQWIKLSPIRWFTFILWTTEQFAWEASV